MSRTRSTIKEDQTKAQQEDQIEAKTDAKSVEDSTKWRKQVDGSSSESDVEVGSKEDETQKTPSSKKITNSDNEVKEKEKEPKGNIKVKMGTENRKKQPKVSLEKSKGKDGERSKTEIAGIAESNKTKKENSSKSSRLCSMFLYLLVTFSVVLVAVFARDYIPEEISPDFLNWGKPESNFNYPKVFESRVEKIKHLFPNQTDRFWKIIKNKGLAHLRERNPKQPLIMLLGAPPSAHAVIDCLARKIAWCLDPEVKLSDMDIINGKTYSQGDGDKTKEILDQKLGELFAKGVRSAVVLHLELLPPPSPNLFYKYCDNDNSPYKHAGIIFTVHLPQETDPSLKPTKAEGSIENYLAKVAWVNYPNDADAVSALLSRIADTVALVNSESNDVVHSVCGA